MSVKTDTPNVATAVQIGQGEEGAFAGWPAQLNKDQAPHFSVCQTRARLDYAVSTPSTSMTLGCVSSSVILPTTFACSCCS
jgi:hypothetical protein